VEVAWIMDQSVAVDEEETGPFREDREVKGLRHAPAGAETPCFLDVVRGEGIAVLTHHIHNVGDAADLQRKDASLGHHQAI
jgi:hypothetical protein